MQVQFKQIAKTRDEAVERKKRLWEEWKSKVGGEVKVGKKKRRKPGKGSGRVKKQVKRKRK